MTPPIRSKVPPAERNRWRTPDKVFDYATKRYGPFDLDAAADEGNHRCDLWLGPGSSIAEDALCCDWGERWSYRNVWCNPPYNREEGESRTTMPPVERWLRKAREQVRLRRVGAVTLLIPATTDSPWFHDLVWNDELGRPTSGVALDLLKGRVNFLRPDGSKAGSPTFASMLVTFF